MTQHPATSALHPLMAQRWSPRAFDPDHELTTTQMTLLLEAARWAPSASNSQPWRFAVARRRGAPQFDALLAALADSNRRWAKNASALIVAAAETIAPDATPRHWAVYDTGQAVAHLTLQAAADGLATHQMGGFDAAVVADLLDLPATTTPLVIVAVGRHNPDVPIDDPARARDAAPRCRQPLDAIVLPVRPRTTRAA